MKTLECSSKGDKRFSALFAKVKVFDVFDSIEAHYQGCKLFEDGEGNLVSAKDWKQAKEWQKQGRKAVRIQIKDLVLPIDYLTPFYKLLWVKYLDDNKGLVEYAKQFDDFTDMFRGSSINCQADVIRQYVKEGRVSIMQECQSLIRLLNKKTFVIEVTGDLLCCPENIIGHQVNAQGAMGAGLAKAIKDKYPHVFEDYLLTCKIHRRDRFLLGMCLLSEAEPNQKWVANLFGQFQPGSVRNEAFTMEEVEQRQKERYEALKSALQSLKKQAQERNLSVALPWKLGSDLAGGDWNVVRQIIEEVFHDYYVTIYRLPNAR